MMVALEGFALRISEGPRQIGVATTTWGECGAASVYRTLTFAALASAALSLSGCISGISNSASAEIDAKRKACDAQTFPNRVSRVRCHNAAEARMGEIVGADLVNVRHATRLVLAEKLDRKEITTAEADLELAKVSSSLASEAIARADRQASAEAQKQTASAQRRASPISNADEPTRLDCITTPTTGGQRTECKSVAPMFITSNPAIR